MMIKSGLLCLMLVALAACQNVYNVTITLRALRPRGFRAYITVDARNTNLLYFYATTYNNMQDALNFGPDKGQIEGAAVRQPNGRWLFEDYFVALTVGTVVKYGIFIPEQLPNAAGDDGLMFNGPRVDYKLFYVAALEDPSAPFPYCLPTITKVRGRQVCAGDVIFEDNFDTLREDVWQIEQYIPTDHPEYPFVSYQRLRSDPNVFVENGNLHIVPKLQDALMSDHNQSIETGSLDLTDGCTRSECSKVAFGPNILPPIVSGRLTSIPFAFTYGFVFIRAKIPRGDWLYPELLLVPLFKKFIGEKALASILKVARISDVLSGFKNFKGWNADERCINGGPHTSTQAAREERSGQFHEFALLWRPDLIKLSLDDVIYMDSNVWWADPCYKDIQSDFQSSLQDYRHLSLGVAAGGSLFPDSIVTDAGHAKPWRNGDAKASLKFWQNKTLWLPTWTAPSLVIDYVKVVALGYRSLVDPSAPPPYCKNTVTKVRGRHVCAGDVVFEDNFDTLQESQWQIEHYIPTDHPEYPFVSYQRLTSEPNVFVENGKLHIVPKLQDELMSDHNLAIETGSLDLTDGCTRNECSKVAFGSDILPPIVSGRLTSIPFAFTYGVVYIRAKIPRGDWLYPELLLVPLFKKFVGEKALASILKVVRISDVVAGFKDFTGWNVDQRCYGGGPHKTTEFVRDELSDDFHEFSLRWTPDAIKLFVDNTMYMDSNVWWADPCYKDIESDFRSSLRDYRHLSLGVAAGGSLFPDSIVTDAGHAKPWRNGDAKASLKFWQNKTLWLPTWTAPSLLIDYVKVVALE
ncbi:beta-1,3-glucan-binding protein [Bicyclus anynana]|uniref:Beta-1,3-glucan-binding protein n=1 Tax=Bicyclus anynana TaxID=110368 RepID=A0ABM3LS80_BICAN|nr:beta-1,3-glucan-binding protein [Bicyclus anynana]